MIWEFCHSAVNQATIFTITDTKFHVSSVTLSTQSNTKLLQQFKSGFKRTINLNKYQSKLATPSKKRYLLYLIEPSFQGVNRLFVLPFSDDIGITGNRKNVQILPNLQIEACNVMIDGQNVFDQALKRDMGTYDNIEKVTTGQEADYTICCLLDYPYFKDHLKWHQ